MKPYWSIHSHSKFSANDAMPGIPEMVEFSLPRELR